MFRLYAFSMANGEREIVVISDLPEADVLSEYTTDGSGRMLDHVLDIDGDATMFPCDRELKHGLS